MKLEFKTLMHGNKFIDINRLGKGLFVIETPIFLEPKLSDDRLKDDWIEHIIMDGKNRIYVNRFIENWDKCQVKHLDVVVTVKN